MFGRIGKYYSALVWAAFNFYVHQHKNFSNLKYSVQCIFIFKFGNLKVPKNRNFRIRDSPSTHIEVKYEQ